MAHGHSPDAHPLAGGMAKPYEQPVKHHKVKDGKTTPPKSKIINGTRPKPV